MTGAFFFMRCQMSLINMRGDLWVERSLKINNLLPFTQKAISATLFTLFGALTTHRDSRFTLLGLPNPKNSYLQYDQH